MLINLVKNALKFTWDGKVKIFMAFDPINSKLIIKVVDTGKGFKQEESGSLFKEFGKL